MAEPVPFPAPVPVTVLTGFLGAGKTTLLNRLLQDPCMAGTACLINEFGEIGLDHLMIDMPDGAAEDTVLLASGCLCCTIRGDLLKALRGLIPRVKDGQIRRVVIETTGLARPAPILQTLQSDPLVAMGLRLDGVVTVVDALNVAHQLTQQSECVEQITVSDIMVLAKTDLVDPAVLAASTERIRAINPGARIVRSQDASAATLFALGHGETAASAKAWLAADDFHDHGHHHAHGGHDVNRHDARIAAFCVTFDEPLHWQGIGNCLEMLASTRGESLLRVKGILNLIGQDRPVVLNGVQHMFYPPTLLPEWPANEPRSSRLVFITRDLPRAVIEDGLRAFAQAAAFA